MTDSSVMTAACACGMAIRYRAEHIGRTVKCRSCGGAVSLTGPERERIRFDDDDDEDAAYAIAAAPVKLPGHSPLAAEAPTAMSTPPSAVARTLGRDRQIESRRTHGFWRDAGRSFLFWQTPTGAIALAVVTVLLLVRSVIGYIPILGLILVIAITGMVWGFYLEVIRYTAGGDDDLPDASEWNGFVDSAIVPIVQLLAVTGACVAPAVALQLAGVDGIPVFVAAAFGAFLWPVTMLAASIGGAGAAVRLDLHVRTVASAFTPYLYVWFMLVVAGLANFTSLLEGMGVLPDFLERAMTSGFLATLVMTFMGVYTTIIVMKLIGLYYRHYSDRFPWDAG